MATLTQVVNGEYVGADKYIIQDAGDGKSTVTFSPDQVLKEGTQVGAGLLNEIQKNGLYYLAGVHRVDGQESIYDCTLVGIDTFDFTQLNVLFKPNTTPTQTTVKLNISGQVYTLTGKILSANQVGLVLVKSESKAYTWANQVEIVNDLTTGGANNALAAEQGVVLNRKIDSLCPYKVGDIFLTTNTTNPSTVWFGTTWQKIEGRFLLGTSGIEASKQTGGSNQKTITQANLPNVKLKVDSFNLTGAPYQAVKSFDTLYNQSGTYGEKVIPVDSWSAWGWCGQDGGGAFSIRMKKANYNTGTTSSASPQTSALGSGQALDITPAYYTCHMWLRTA